MHYHLVSIILISKLHLALFNDVLIEIAMIQNIIYLLFATLIATTLSCDTYQGQRRNVYGNTINKKPNEPGKCYAKCLTPEIVIEEMLSFHVYTGNDAYIDSLYVKTERIEIAPKSQKWIKKKADRNCHSSDPNDCLVWCLIEVPAQIITIENMLIDSTVTMDYVKESHKINYVSQTRNQEVWMTVLCDPTDQQLKKIQEALIRSGYNLNIELLQRNFGKASRKALTQYQKDNQLHIGGITEETLTALDIEYD